MALPEDLTGYDAHMNSFAWKVAAGIAAIITGVAVGVLFDSEGTVSGLLARSEFLTFVCTIIGVIIGLAFLIPAGMTHSEFVRRHPFIEDFYTDDDRSRRAKELAVGVVGGIIMLIATVVGLWMLFTGGPIDGGGHERWLSGNGLFWLAWPIGGILCGVATCIIQIFRSFHDRDR